MNEKSTTDDIQKENEEITNRKRYYDKIAKEETG